MTLPNPQFNDFMVSTRRDQYGARVEPRKPSEFAKNKCRARRALEAKMEDSNIEREHSIWGLFDD